jgi:hypothetical protein
MPRHKVAILVAALLPLGACATSMKLPGTQDGETERIRALTHAIEKQADAIIAVVGKATPTPTPTPTPNGGTK